MSVNNIMYIHFETGSNSILSHGISLQDFSVGIKVLPRHLLLLKPTTDEIGRYNQHTGFFELTQDEQVKHYFEQPQSLNTQWLDFIDSTLLDQLTPVEVSEMLYLGHSFMHLKSPFYYKLQNNYAYLALPDDFSKVYYRHLHQFTPVFNQGLKRNIQRYYNKGRFFKKELSLPIVSEELVKSLRNLFIEGCAIDLNQCFYDDKQFSLPIYIGDRYLNLEQLVSDEQNFVGYLKLDVTQQKWNLAVQHELVNDIPSF